MSRQACARCGSRNIASTPNPTPAQRARHDRGLPCAALTWLRHHPGTEVDAASLAAELLRAGWDPPARTRGRTRALHLQVRSVLYNLATEKLIRRVGPGRFVFDDD